MLILVAGEFSFHNRRLDVNWGILQIPLILKVKPVVPIIATSSTRPLYLFKKDKNKVENFTTQMRFSNQKIKT